MWERMVERHNSGVISVLVAYLEHPKPYRVKIAALSIDGFHTCDPPSLGTQAIGRAGIGGQRILTSISCSLCTRALSRGHTIRSKAGELEQVEAQELSRRASKPAGNLSRCEHFDRPWLCASG